MSRARRVVSYLLVTCAVTTASAAGAQSTGVPQKVIVVPPGVTASATLSPGVRVGDVLYVSGQLGTKPGSTASLDSTIQGQTRQALENVRAVVEAAGTTMANVVKCTVFLADVHDFAGMNQAYVLAFPKEPPARSTVAVAALVRADAKVEIECIAAIRR